MWRLFLLLWKPISNVLFSFIRNPCRTCSAHSSSRHCLQSGGCVFARCKFKWQVPPHTHTRTQYVWEWAGYPLHFSKWHFLPLHTPDYALNCCLATIWTGPNCCNCVCCFSVCVCVCGQDSLSVGLPPMCSCLTQVCINDGLMWAINSQHVCYCFEPKPWSFPNHNQLVIVPNPNQTLTAP